ncbi:MAG: hypothetical protein WCJ87_00130 [Burkholderiales bacterium]
MPYDGQQASKGGHSDIIRNPEVRAFLEKCAYLREPSAAEGEAIAATFHEAPRTGELPAVVIASDASPFSDPISHKFPSTQVGYVNVSLIAFDMADFNGLQPSGSKFVDPHMVAEFHRKAKKVSFVLPGANVRYGGASSVKNGFRLAVYDQLSDERTKIEKNGCTLADTLLVIEGGKITVDKCPSCGAVNDFMFLKCGEVIPCPNCLEKVYVTDALRIHEQISDFGDNTAAITRFMNAAEHLQICTLLKTMSDNSLETLSKSAVMVDGPLALFGQPAKFHASLQAFYNQLFEKCASRGLPPPLIMGLQKEGQVMEHARSIAAYLKPGTFNVISDEYRATYIVGIQPRNDNFGHETYYGQDFIYKTDAGQIFDVCLAYPMVDKKDRAGFGKRKSEISRYEPWLARAFALVRHLEFDLYESAVVPIALAHRHASISLRPGGAMLEVLTKRHLGA